MVKNESSNPMIVNVHWKHTMNNNATLHACKSVPYSRDELKNVARRYLVKVVSEKINDHTFYDNVAFIYECNALVRHVNVNPRTLECEYVLSDHVQQPHVSFSVYSIVAGREKEFDDELEAILLALGKSIHCRSRIRELAPRSMDEPSEFVLIVVVNCD